jgi:hypothetical protein
MPLLAVALAARIVPGVEHVEAYFRSGRWN